MAYTNVAKNTASYSNQARNVVFDDILMETGDRILMESGDAIRTETLIVGFSNQSKNTASYSNQARNT